MSSQKLLPFQNDILKQLSAPSPNSDGLLLLARGLGMRNILCAYLESFTDDEESLVILVNATPEEERGLAEELGMRMTVIGFEMPAKDRQKLYEKGGVLSITTRILIIDMLNERIPVSEMTGIVVLHAEAVTPTSMEAFVMRVYREKNKVKLRVEGSARADTDTFVQRGFIKAFSDEPESFTYGVAPLQTVLTQLQIRHVFLYPRFHETVSRDLEAKGADVLNLHQPLSENMDIIQTAIIECMDATLAELKRSNNIVSSPRHASRNLLKPHSADRSGRAYCTERPLQILRSGHQGSTRSSLASHWSANTTACQRSRNASPASLVPAVVRCCLLSSVPGDYPSKQHHELDHWPSCGQPESLAFLAGGRHHFRDRKKQSI
jgi:hypothetical protein